MSALVPRDRSAAWWTTVALCAAMLSIPVLATLWGLGDGTLVNADEAVAALLPVDLVRGQVSILFPGNAYQGVLELPAYGVSWLVFGADELPPRLLHQAIWVGALLVWAKVALDALESTRWSGTSRSRQLAVLAAVALVGLTSVNGWAVWFRIYPGYHLGALLAGVAVLIATRARTMPWCALAGLMAGLAVYAQPMHGAGVLIVIAVLAVSGPGRRRRRIGVAALGVLAGVSPLLLWNLRNGFAALDSQPVVHPDWTYSDRLVNTFRVSTRVLWGESGTRADALAGSAPLRVLAMAVLALALVAGVAVMIVSWRSTWSRSIGVLAMLVGLPVLDTFSLDIDLRYAVAWWPALVVLVTWGVLGASSVTVRTGRRVVAGVVVVGVVAQLAVTVLAAVPQIQDRRSYRDAQELTASLAADLESCGVDTAAGSYWSVYAAAYASDAELDASVQIGPERLVGLAPPPWPQVDRVAWLPPSDGPVERWTESMASLTRSTGRGRHGWIETRHRATDSHVFLERIPDDPLPAGCVGSERFEPL